MEDDISFWTLFRHRVSNIVWQATPIHKQSFPLHDRLHTKGIQTTVEHLDVNVSTYFI